MMGVNIALKRFGEAWVPVKAQSEVRMAHPPDFGMSYRHRIVIEDLEIDPNYVTRKAFVMDDVPEGTRTTFLGAGGRPMPGEFVWRDDKPLPCVDEEAVARLESIADDLTGQIEKAPDGVPLPDSHFKWGAERVEFLLQGKPQKSSIAPVKRKQRLIVGCTVST